MWRLVTMRLFARSMRSISAVCVTAGAKIRRTGLRMWLAETRPVIISPMKPWKAWKFSRPMTVTRTSPRLIAGRSRRQTVIGT